MRIKIKLPNVSFFILLQNPFEYARRFGFAAALSFVLWLYLFGVSTSNAEIPMAFEQQDYPAQEWEQIPTPYPHQELALSTPSSLANNLYISADTAALEQTTIDSLARESDTASSIYQQSYPIESWIPISTPTHSPYSMEEIVIPVSPENASRLLLNEDQSYLFLEASENSFISSTLPAEISILQNELLSDTSLVSTDFSDEARRIIRTHFFENLHDEEFRRSVIFGSIFREPDEPLRNLSQVEILELRHIALRTEDRQARMRGTQAILQSLAEDEDPESARSLSQLLVFTYRILYEDSFWIRQFQRLKPVQQAPLLDALLESIRNGNQQISTLFLQRSNDSYVLHFLAQLSRLARESESETVREKSIQVLAEFAGNRFLMHRFREMAERAQSEGQTYLGWLQSNVDFLQSVDLITIRNHALRASSLYSRRHERAIEILNDETMPLSSRFAALAYFSNLPRGAWDVDDHSLNLIIGLADTTSSTLRAEIRCLLTIWAIETHQRQRTFLSPEFTPLPAPDDIARERANQMLVAAMRNLRALDSAAITGVFPDNLEVQFALRAVAPAATNHPESYSMFFIILFRAAFANPEDDRDPVGLAHQFWMQLNSTFMMNVPPDAYPAYELVLSRAVELKTNSEIYETQRQEIIRTINERLGLVER